MRRMKSAVEKLVLNLRKSIIGRPITFRRIAADSLLLYVDCEPGDDHGFAFWFNPPWHYCSAGRVLVGSNQTQPGRDGVWPTTEELDRISARMRPLHGKAVTALEVDSWSHDLSLDIGSIHRVKSFADRPASRENWSIKDVAGCVYLVGSSTGLKRSLAKSVGRQR
jgi:hypothetical protein